MLDSIASLPLSTVSDDDLSFTLCELQVLSARLDALRGRVTERAELVLSDPEKGIRSAAQIVGRDTNGDQSVVRSDLRLARWLATFPVFAQAFAVGVLTSGHIKMLRKAENPRSRQAMIDQQDFLVDTATNVDFKQFEQVLCYWLHAADPDGDEPKNAERDMGCRYKQNSDGSVSGSFRLDPVNGQAFTNAIERLRLRRTRRRDRLHFTILSPVDARDLRPAIQGPVQRTGMRRPHLVAPGRPHHTTLPRRPDHTVQRAGPVPPTQSHEGRSADRPTRPGATGRSLRRPKAATGSPVVRSVPHGDITTR